MKFELIFSKKAKKDIKTLSTKLKVKLKKLLVEVISKDPYIGKKLLGEFEGTFSYRLSLKDRILYSVDLEKKQIFVKRARTHYGD